MPFTFSLKQIVVGGLLLFASAEAAVISSSHAQYTVVNNCPDAILVRNNDTNSTLAAGSSITKTLPINNAGTFVGSTPGFGAISGLIAGFQAPSTYYIAKLSRTPVFYGVSIAPSTVPATPNSEALCSKARCDNVDCADALPNLLQELSTLPFPDIHALGMMYLTRLSSAHLEILTTTIYKFQNVVG
ncbi:hypothetical protein JR316_0001401 [Psilocybe cubensis]|uniref:Uncharacterized protein n=2 Tax=Psilocybe cubensis TaxID=181762 RepID=A0ACB8HHE1_PSICU|nr:hypothetical protein JR316_0001401 [Psilocybe cubensis]KAH9487328.1 hypothetical protein JR316_0001401 [Psilocybe cubensis]